MNCAKTTITTSTFTITNGKLGTVKFENTDNSYSRQRTGSTITGLEGDYANVETPLFYGKENELSISLQNEMRRVLQTL
jgi:hypothetical protein